MGHLLIDDRVSGGELKEFDTVSCKHCQAVIKIKRGQKDGAWCNLCFGPVCNTKVCASKCKPFFKKVEEKLRRQALFKAMGIN